MFLKEQLDTTKEQYEKRIGYLQKQKSGQGNTTLYWMLIVAAAIIGIFLGRGCH